MFEDKNINIAIRFAHISAAIPFWGILVALVCYKYISKKRPDRRDSVIEPFAWQIGLTIFHFLCILLLLTSYLFFRNSQYFMIFSIALFVVWLTVYIFSMITSFTAAKFEVAGNRFRYPIFSSLIRRKRTKSVPPKGSIFYPFEDYMDWK